MTLRPAPCALLLIAAALACPATAAEEPILPVVESNANVSVTAPATPATTNALPLADEVRRQYDAIQTLSCSIRKSTVVGDKTVRMLSRVHYQAPHRVNVENIAPTRRRIVVDGQRLFYHEEGAPRGFSRDINALEGEMRVAALNIPGSPVEHLLKLEGIPEEPLPPLEGQPRRARYRREDVSVTIACDDLNRLVAIDLYADAACTRQTASYRFEQFVPAGTDCWLPTIHRASVNLPDGEVLTETRRLDNVVVNQPLAGGLFDAQVFFPDVAFVDDFQKTYAP